MTVPEPVIGARFLVALDGRALPHRCSSLRARPGRDSGGTGTPVPALRQVREAKPDMENPLPANDVTSMARALGLGMTVLSHQLACD